MKHQARILCVLVLFCAIAAAQEESPDHRSREYLDSLDDVTLLLQPDARAALEVYKERSANYSKEQNNAVMRAYHKARAEQRSIDSPTTEVLLERMSTSTDPVQRRNAMFAFQRQYEKANDGELQAMRDAFLAAWRALPIPPAYEKSGVQQGNYSSFYFHLRHLFPNEADVLPILEERCVESGLHNGLKTMFLQLSNGQFELGPLTAAKAEEVYNAEFRPEKVASGGGEDRAILRSSLLSVLGQCGESGMAALRRLDILHTPEGLSALREMDMETAEPLLWEIVESPDTNLFARLDTMEMILRKAYNYPDPDRKLRFREPLSALMTAPTSSESYQLKRLERVIDLAYKLNDAYYHAHLVALQSSLDWEILAQAEHNAQGGMDPEKFPLKYTVASLRTALDATSKSLRE